MNAQVEAFLKKEQFKEQIKRKEHLISLGLCDKTKTELIQCDRLHPNAIYNVEKQGYYREIYKAIEVTDEEYEMICKFEPVNNTDNSDLQTKTKKLNGYGTVNVVIGIIAIIIGAILTIVFLNDYHLDELWYVPLLSGVFGGIGYLAVGRFLQVIAGVAKNLNK